MFNAQYCPWFMFPRHVCDIPFVVHGQHINSICTKDLNAGQGSVGFIIQHFYRLFIDNRSTEDHLRIVHELFLTFCISVPK